MIRPGPLNLASRPFRNETLPAIGFAVATLLVLGLSAWQISTARRLLPAAGRTLYAEAKALDAELAELRGEARRLSGERLATDRLQEWRLVQQLVDRRTFSWTALLGRLEELLPSGVRLVAISPEFRAGVARIDLDAIARSRAEGFELVRVFQDSGGFSEVLPSSVNPGPGGEQFQYTMTYHPEVGARGSDLGRADRPSSEPPEPPLDDPGSPDSSELEPRAVEPAQAGPFGSASTDAQTETR